MHHHRRCPIGNETQNFKLSSDIFDRSFSQFLSAVALFLLTLGLAHAQDVAALLAADMEETVMHDDNPTALLFSPSSDGLSSSSRSHNEEQLLRAQSLATGADEYCALLARSFCQSIIARWPFLQSFVAKFVTYGLSVLRIEPQL
jgi:hypothetical protein